MLRKLLPLCCVVGTALCISACQREAPSEATATSAAPPAAASDPSTKKAPTDLEQLAQRLVTQSAGVIEGELILIGGGAQDQELLENIAVHVRKVGAFPLVQLNSDRMMKRLFFDVPEKFDTQTDALGLKVADTFNAVIAVNSNLDEGPFADADPKRQAARAKAGQSIADAFVKRKVRLVEVGNGLYPTDWLAKRFGMTHDELTRAFWDGVNIDYSSLAGRAEQVKAALTGANEVHITHANGTDLKVRIQGRPVYASDGIISRAEAQKGGAAANVYLPAGEVYVTPVAGTAEGKVVREREYFQGKEIQNLALTFAGGKLTSITGSGPGFQQLKALYDAAGEGKDVFAAVDFGINPNIKLPANSAVGTWVPAGMVTVGVGNNIWAGGDNKAAYGYFVSLPGTTVTLDAKPTIENGQLKI